MKTPVLQVAEELCDERTVRGKERGFDVMVRMAGLEPARYCYH